MGMRCPIDQIDQLCWLLDVLLPSMVNECSIHHVGMLVIGCSVGHDGYWMSYWWFLDALFIVVVGRFDKHKQKNRLKQNFTTKLLS